MGWKEVEKKVKEGGREEERVEGRDGQRKGGAEKGRGEGRGKEWILLFYLICSFFPSISLPPPFLTPPPFFTLYPLLLCSHLSENIVTEAGGVGVGGREEERRYGRWGGGRRT